MDAILTQVKLFNAFDESLFRQGKLRKEKIRSVTVQASVDANCFRSTIPSSLAKELGVEKPGEISDALIFHVLDRTCVDDAIIIGDQVSLGYIASNKLDLRIDSKRRRVIPNPAHPNGPVFRV